MNEAVWVPILGGLLALMAAALGVLATRQRTKADERTEFTKSVLTEVQSLRTADQLNETRVGELWDKLHQAEADILTCKRECNQWEARCIRLEANVERLEGRIEELQHKERKGRTEQ